MQILKLSHPSRRGYPSPTPFPMQLRHNKAPATLITPPGTFFQIENPALPLMMGKHSDIQWGLQCYPKWQPPWK